MRRLRRLIPDPDVRPWPIVHRIKVCVCELDCHLSWPTQTPEHVLRRVFMGKIGKIEETYQIPAKHCLLVFMEIRTYGCHEIDMR